MSSKKYHKYSNEDVQNALEAIKNGESCSTAARKYGVPRTTLIGKKSGKYPVDCKSGVSTILTTNEENLLTKWIINMAKMGFPITKNQLLDSVAILVDKLKRDNNFHGGRPGRHWYEGFLKRHPQISQRMSQNLCASRAAVTETKIKCWFQEIEEYFQQENININEPERIFNSDESAFFLSPKGSNVLAPKGTKTVYDRSGNDKECLTVLITGNAAGKLAPPMVMYPYERIPKHIAMKVPKGWGIGKSESGWMTSESFFEYITNIFHPWLIRENFKFPILLYVDGHKSHVTSPLSDFCRDKGIILISLLPNSTHILQPLDVGLFRSLKNSWKNKVRKFRTEEGQKALNRENFAPVLRDALDDLQNIESIFRNAFRTCGLHPFNVMNVDFSKILSESNLTPQKDADQLANVDQTIIGHLRFLESILPLNIVNKFYTLRGNEWSDEIEYKQLYNTWHKILKMSGLEVGISPTEEVRENQSRNGTTEVVENVVIEIENGLNLEEGWENNILIQDLDITESNYLEMNSSNISESHNNNLDFQSVKEGQTTEETQNITPLENVCEVTKYPNSTYLTESNGVELFSESLIYEDPEDRGTETQLENVLKASQSQQEHLNETTPENSITKEPTDNTVVNLNITETQNENSKYENLLPGVVVPSPFKTALFWPEPIASKKWKTKKEKMPSVATSDAWKNYYDKKNEEKKKIAEEKEERKRKRQENKTKHEENIGRRKRQRNVNPERDENQINMRKGKENFQTENTREYMEDIQKSNENVISEIKLNDYVIITYLEEMYPGIVTDIKGSEVKVKAMCKSGPNYWTWPKVEDEIWYNYEEILEKIAPPIKVNKRNVFEVRELNNNNNT